MRYFLAAALMAFCSFGWSGAEASTANGSFNVQVTIAATCVVTSATNLNFGTQGVLAANIDQTSAINVTCTNTTPYNIGLDKGLNGASVTTRQMKAGGPALINYSLFSDAGRTVNWGNTVTSPWSPTRKQPIISPMAASARASAWTASASSARLLPEA
jgi:spore coat protein U domain-containing protein, fimbrial subunit CupE1/2/3/6